MNRNLEAIAIAAARECVRQQVDEDALIRLLQAHSYALGNWNRLPRLSDVLELGRLIEPAPLHRSIIRDTPVTFQAGNRPWAVAAQLIEPTLAAMFTALDMEDVDADEFTKAFLDVHPFRDGNGRAAWVLLNWLRESLDEPVALPDYYQEMSNA